MRKILVYQGKEDALATSRSLIHASESQFQAKDLSRAALNDIAGKAEKADTGRGAIYGAFGEKPNLFNATMKGVARQLSWNKHFRALRKTL